MTTQSFKGGGPSIRRVLPLVLLACLALAACGLRAAPPVVPPPAPSPPPPPPPPREVVLGAAYPLSGPFAAGGLAAKRGIDLAAQVVNGRYDLDLPLGKGGGLPGLGGARVRVVWEDTQGDPAHAALATERLITQDHAVAVLGGYLPGGDAPASEVAESHGIPFVSPGLSLAALSGRGYRWFFHLGPDENALAAAAFGLLAELRGAGRITPADTLGLIYEDSELGRAAAAAAAGAAARAGFRVAADIPYPPQGADVSAEVQTLAASHPSILIDSSGAAGTGLLAAALARLHLQPKAVLQMVPSTLPQRDGLLGTALFPPDLELSKLAAGELDGLFRARYGTDPGGVAASAFTGLLVLADAVNRAGSTAPDAVRRSLLATDIPAAQLPLPWGGVRFGPDGANPLARVVVEQVQDGHAVTVWPAAEASARLVWPLPQGQGEGQEPPAQPPQAQPPQAQPKSAAPAAPAPGGTAPSAGG